MTTIITLSLLGLIMLVAGIYRANKALIPIGIVGLLLVFIANLFQINTIESYFSPFLNNMLNFDNYAVVFSAVIIAATTLLLFFYIDNKEHINIPIAEVIALFLFANVGAVVMVSYSNLVMLFLGIEILSISLYILAGSKKRDLLSNEASMKYFLMGAFATGFLLFGIALIYGASGSFDMMKIRIYVTEGFAGNLGGGYQPGLLYTGVLMMLIGLAFKISAVPFHFWAPDVYQGSPNMVTAFMATVVKTAGVAALYRLFSTCFAANYTDWAPVIVFVSIITMTVGNISAVFQVSFKRMLAYSSIAHAGYFLIAIVALDSASSSAIFLYAAAYCVASIAAFAGLMLVQQTQGRNQNFESFNGLAKKNPLLAFGIAVAMLSLSGIPPTAGFFAKFFIFSTALNQGYLMLVVIAILNSTISLYFYFRVIIAMYFRKEQDNSEQVTVSSAMAFLIIICILLNFALGIFPQLLADIS